MMHTFSQELPESQLTMDLGLSVRSKFEHANRAVFEAVMVLAEFDDPMGPYLFGTDRESLRLLVQHSKNKKMPVLTTGIPIFTLRLATAEFKSVIENNAGSDARVKSLLNTFEGPIPLSSLTGMPATQDVPASQLTLDMGLSVRSKFEQANRAVFDVVTALAEYDDPMAPNLFGAERETLRLLARQSKGKMMPILTTGIPIFKLRVNASDFYSGAEEVEGSSAGVAALLRSFNSQIQPSVFA
ncbi:hypothetical protein [Pseudoduganella sp. R-34]|jgi:hypothetical protein|uniref:hypothetical protein n=1 Tax=Pseudoduganella sp. R-34 TaxID=3404062 RepID=UPI003CFADFB6